MTGKTIKKVLIIAQRFPPAGGVGTIRVTKFVKYLREFGWEPVVLTVRPDCYPSEIWLDPSLAKDVPKDIAIYRTGIWRADLINDEGIRWLPYLLSALGKVIIKEKPKVVYLTGGPFLPLLAGPFIKFLFRLPYVVDLRDPWRLARRALPTRGLKARLGKLFANVCEPLVIRHAAKVICVSEYMCKQYQQAYRHLVDKFVVITNGYDPDDVNGVVPFHFTAFTIVYTGKFRTSEAFRNPGPFFQALRICQENGCNIQFVHVGPIEQEVVNMANQAGVSKLVKFVGPKPHAETLAYARGADLLLLIGGGQKTEQTGKIFDYIVCSRPILALAPLDGEIAEVAKEVAFAKILPNENPEAIAKVLIEEMETQDLNIIPKEPSLDLKFHRRRLTEVLARIFDDICY
jgi:glycosyltransferase involved in cell wall biosynthesis